jgi:excisionase family DNA binding protein
LIEADLQGANMTTGTKLLTRNEAAELLGVRPQTLAVWAITGKYGLPVVKVGRSVRYRMTDLERWLESRTVGAAAAE